MARATSSVLRSLCSQHLRTFETPLRSACTTYHSRAFLKQQAIYGHLQYCCTSGISGQGPEHGVPNAGTRSEIPKQSSASEETKRSKSIAQLLGVIKEAGRRHSMERQNTAATKLTDRQPVQTRIMPASSQVEGDRMPDSELGVDSVESISPADDTGIKHAPRPDVPFATLFRRSKLAQLGDPEGSLVIGTIFETHGDDLYIDFGGKFHCVCKRPSPKVRARFTESESTKEEAEAETTPSRLALDDYRRGTKVLLRLHELEMCAKFLGASGPITLLEADASLVRILGRPGGADTASATGR